MKEIPLTQGHTAIVDDEDFEIWGHIKWCAVVRPKSRTVYAVRYVRPDDEGTRSRLLHRVILNAPRGVEVDHIDGNGLNNCKSNLRLDYTRQNNQNRAKQVNNKSGYIGVSWSKSASKWQAFVKLDGKNRYVGVYEEATDAAKARDAEARRLHGEYARLNFPEGD
jgi:hypothetical protein